MAKQEPPTEQLPARDAPAQWEALLSAVARGEKRVLLDRDGRAGVALISADDLELLCFYESKRAERFAAWEHFGAAFAHIPEDEWERGVARANEEARIEARARKRAGDRPPTDEEIAAARAEYEAETAAALRELNAS